MAVLLIGSTGNGKSTLANFLVSPDKDHIFGDQQTFKTARTNMPETQYVLSSTFDVSMPGLTDSRLTVIDTPGIFEDENKDIKHMIDIIRALHTVGEIRACILVVRFSSKIDIPYRASVKYYSKLLSGLFETNLIIVVTDYASDERSKSLRELQGIDEEQIVKNIVTEIVEVSGVKRCPKLFTIDCLPITDGELATSNTTREDIIRHVVSFNSMSTKDLQVAKTDSIIADDKVTIAKLEGEVTANQERLLKANANAKVAHDNLNDQMLNIRDLEGDIVTKKEELTSKDSKDLVEANAWSVSERWKWFKTQSRTFNVESKWPIRNISYWTNGKSRWVNKEKLNEHCATGSVKGKFMRGLYAKVTLEVYKCDRDVEDIDRLKDAIGMKEEALSDTQQEYSQIKLKHEEISKEVSSLIGSIDNKTEDITKLSSEYLSMEECLNRFQL